MSKYKFEDFAINITQKKTPEPDDYATYIGLEHMDSRTLKISRWGSDVPIIGEKLIMHKGDILLGKRNAYLRRAAIAPHDGIFSAHGMILRPKEEIIDYDFFTLFIASDYFFDEAIRISVGSLSPTINWKDLKSLEFNIPSLDKQKKIAKVLCSINETISYYREMIDVSDELIKSRFIEMINSYKYDVKNLEDVSVEWMKGQNFKKDEIDENGKNKCIHYGELFTKYNEYIYDIYSKTNSKGVRISKEGDILFPASDVTPIGLTKCSSIQVEGVILGGDIIIMRPTNENNSIYLSYAIRNEKDDLIKRVTGSVVRHISSKSLKTLEIKIIPRNAQDEFVNFAKLIDKSKFEFQKGIEKLESLYKKIFTDNMMIK